jgi:hypothetical protein
VNARTSSSLDMSWADVDVRGEGRAERELYLSSTVSVFARPLLPQPAQDHCKAAARPLLPQPAQDHCKAAEFAESTDGFVVIICKLQEYNIYFRILFLSCVRSNVIARVIMQMTDITEVYGDHVCLLCLPHY